MSVSNYRDLRNQLLDALHESDRGEVERLLGVAPEFLPEVFDSQKFRGEILWCVSKLDQAILRLLLGAGWDLNRHDSPPPAPDGVYPLNRCVSENAYDQAKFLLENGADPNLCNAIWSAIGMRDASDESQRQMCELLMEYGVDVLSGPATLPEYTPILRAIYEGKTDLVEFFKSHGAEIPESDEEPKSKLDLDTFQERLEAACRECWNTMRSEFPDDTFCMFGLETDSDYVILNPLLDSEQAIERDSRNRPSGESYVSRISLDSDSEFYGQGKRFLDELSAELNSVYGVQMTDREDGRRMKAIGRILENTLKNLDGEGLFGTGDKRNKIVLLVSIIDADRREWKTMLKTAKRINPAEVFKQFAKTFK